MFNLDLDIEIPVNVHPFTDCSGNCHFAVGLWIDEIESYICYPNKDLSGYPITSGRVDYMLPAFDTEEEAVSFANEILGYAKLAAMPA